MVRHVLDMQARGAERTPLGRYMRAGGGQTEAWRRAARRWWLKRADGEGGRKLSAFAAIERGRQT